MVDDAELSVDVVESVLPERVVGAFFTADAAVAEAVDVTLPDFIDC